MVKMSLFDMIRREGRAAAAMRKKEDNIKVS